jgi:uncharacterized protein
MVKRHAENYVMQLLRQFPAVAILGPRQVGKTTLAMALAKQLKKEVLYLDLERNRDRILLSDMDTFFEEHKDECVIIDEVQVLPEIFASLRPAIDEQRKAGRFILLGSASPLLVKGVSETLAGRIAYVNLAPFSLVELTSSKTQQLHWFRGGFPNALLAKNETESKRWLNMFIETYIQKDLTLLFGINANSIVIRNFWAMLAYNQGSIWNADLYARALGVSSTTLVKYLGMLEGAFLVRRLQPYFVNANKRLVKSPKIYIRDSGVLHQLCDIDSKKTLQKNVLIGASWEGYVIEEICKNLPSNIVPFFFRAHSGAECDLVLVKASKPWACIEIKHSSTPTLSRGYYEVISLLKPIHKWVVTPNANAATLKEGIKVTTLTGFLTTLPPIR